MSAERITKEGALRLLNYHVPGLMRPQTTIYDLLHDLRTTSFYKGTGLSTDIFSMETSIRYGHFPILAMRLYHNVRREQPYWELQIQMKGGVSWGGERLFIAYEGLPNTQSYEFFVNCVGQKHALIKFGDEPFLAIATEGDDINREPQIRVPLSELAQKGEAIEAVQIDDRVGKLVGFEHGNGLIAFQYRDFPKDGDNGQIVLPAQIGVKLT